MPTLKSGMFLLLGMAAASMLATLPARANDDRVTLRVGVMHVDGETQLNGNLNGTTNAVDYRSEHFEFGKRTGPRIEGMLHFSARNRVLFNYLRYQRNRQFDLDHDIDIDGFVVPAGSAAKTHAKVGLGSLVYDYAVLETPTMSMGLQFGAAWADVDGRVRAITGSLVTRGRDRASGVAPVIGLRFASSTPGQRWHFSAQGQYVNADWGSLDSYSGSLTRLNALGEYRFTPHLGAYVGYDWFRLKVNHDFGSTHGGIDLRFKGPLAGLSVVF